MLCGSGTQCFSSAGVNGTGENGRTDSAHGRVEVVERLLLDLRRDLGAEAAEANRLVDDDRAVGLGAPTRSTVSMSSGCSVRGSMTSQSMPSPASVSAASERVVGHLAPGDHGDVVARRASRWLCRAG